MVREEWRLMELRHLRCFLVVAEELHFARAAARLHVEQSPLSRTIRQLEDDLGVRLFERNSHSTRLTWAGQVFQDEARRVLATVEQARASARAAATGYRGVLRIALSDGISQTHLSTLLARCRQEAPEVDIRLSEVPLCGQIRGLRDGLYDAGFSKAEHPGEGILASPAWHESLVIAVPARHPVLAYPELPIDVVLRHPLILRDPGACAGCSRQVEKMLNSAGRKPDVVELVATHDLMMVLVAAGFGLGVTTETHLKINRHPEVVARSLTGEVPVLTTYLLRQDGEPSQELVAFMDRVSTLEAQ